jgi:hypothetical protein
MELDVELEEFLKNNRNVVFDNLIKKCQNGDTQALKLLYNEIKDLSAKIKKRNTKLTTSQIVKSYITGNE